MSPLASTRWCPTPEQLMILEEMYRSGIRTPNASLIKQITAHLSHYGKIEGKNVFYWFQNHKARDRQKLRRKLSKQLQQQQQQQQQLYHYHHYYQQQWSNQQNQHIASCCLDCPASAFQQLSCHNQASFLPQGGPKEAFPQGKTYTRNYSLEKIPEQVGMEDNPFMTMYYHDWMMSMNDVKLSSPPCCQKPLKTLELFPLNSTNLKEESSHLSCSTSTN